MKYNAEVFDSRNTAMCGSIEARSFKSAINKARKLSVYKIIVNKGNGEWVEVQNGKVESATSADLLD